MKIPIICSFDINAVFYKAPCESTVLYKKVIVTGLPF